MRPTLLRWALPPIVFAATLVAFLPALDNGFVQWDDDRLLVENERFRGFSPERLRWMFSTHHMGHYQPLTWLSFALDHELHGLDPRGYHATSLLLHAATAVAFYFLSRRLLAVTSGTHPPGGASLCLAAAVSALLFSVHPLRVESVAWVTERRDVLSGLFLVGAVLAYLRGVSIGRVPLAGFGWQAVSVACTALSLLAKAWGMGLPVVLLVLDAHPLRRWRTRRDLGRLLVQKLPFVALGLAAAIQAFLAQRAQVWGMLGLTEHGPILRLGQAAYGVVFYPWRTLVPRSLSPLYVVPADPDPLSPELLLSAGLVALVATAAWRVRRGFPAGLAVWVSYLAIVAPVLGLAQSGPQLVADRYSYLACLGFALLGGAGFQRLFDAGPRRRLVAVVLAVAALATLGAGTWSQTRVWRTTETLWQRVLEIDPDSWLGHLNYGGHLLQRDELQRALPHVERAVELHPGSGLAWKNLGNAMARLGRLPEARRAYERALPLVRSPGEVCFELGSIHFRDGRPEQAIELYRQAIAEGAHVARAHAHVAFIHERLGRRVQAVEEYEEALRHDPGLPIAREGLERLLRGG